MEGFALKIQPKKDILIPVRSRWTAHAVEDSMKYVALYFGIMLIGYWVGSQLRYRGKVKSKWISRMQAGAVTVLIFVMSSRIGFNHDVLKSMGSIGWMAFVTVVFALAGSLLFVHVARKLMGINRKGERSID